MIRRLVAPVAVLLVSASLVGDAQSVQYPDPTQRVLTHREQNAIVTPWIKKRFDTVLAPLMAREGIDMWIMPTREYNEDPVFASMSPLTYYASRRRTILVFYNPGGGKPVERYSVGRFDYDGIYTLVPTHNDAQYEGLRKLVDQKNPKVIGINESDAWQHADGITANEKRRLVEALGPHAAKIKSAEMLAVGWLEVKIPEELEAYRHAMKVAHMVIREAFSNKVITPGKTTNEDVAWWMRQRVEEMGLGKWFQPSVTIWRQGEKTNPRGAILPGDMLHTDFGIVYLGFSTDTQHNAYVLKPGETDAPAGLKAGLKAGNRLQDLTMQYCEAGADGQPGARRCAGPREERRDRAVDLLPPRWLSRPRRRSADRHDRLPAGRARSRRLRVPSEHLALDRVERDAQRPRVGRPGGALRARRRRGDHARREVGLDRWPAGNVLSDQAVARAPKR